MKVFITNALVFLIALTATTTVALFLGFIFLFVPITIHELGHYGAFKSNGYAVKVCQTGIGPSLTICSVGETDFRVGIFPVGGFNHPYNSKEIVEKKINLKSVEEATDGEILWIASAGVIANLLSVFMVFGILTFREVKISKNSLYASVISQYRIIHTIVRYVFKSILTFGRFPHQKSTESNFLYRSGIVRAWIAMTAFIIIFNLIPISDMDGTRILDACLGLFEIEFPFVEYAQATNLIPFLYFLILFFQRRD